MKKIFFILLGLMSCFLSFCQTFPINQGIGSPTTLVTSNGGLRSTVGFINTVYTDTATANLNSYIKNYAGAQIRTLSPANVLWLRNSTATAWILLAQRFGQPGEDVSANVNRSFDLNGNTFSVVDGNWGFGSTNPSQTLSIGHIDGDETAVMYTPDGTVFMIETKSGASMQILSNTQISVIPDPSGGQLVLDGSIDNYFKQKYYTGGGGFIAEMGTGVYDALNDESEFFFKAYSFDTITTYLTFYDKMKFINIPNDDAITKIIGIDANDNVRYINSSSIGGGGLSGGNLGAGYRYYVPASSGIKTSIADNGLSLDSATSNILTYKLGGTLTANTTITQGSNSINFSGTGITTIGTAITSSTGRLQVQNPTAGGQNAAFGPLLSNNVYLANYAIDSVTAATVAGIKSTGIYTRRKIVVNSGNFSRGGLWNMASDLMFETRDSFRLDPVGSDLLAGIIARILMQPAGTGRSIVQNGTFKDDYVAAIVAAIQNDNTNTSNWILNRGYKASLVTHFINGGSKDTTENYAGVFSTALNSGRILRANQFYAGPIGNVDSLFAFYAPYAAFNYFYSSLRLGGDVAGNSYVADASAMLDISTTTKGVLLPRMTETQRDAISSPATGLLIYQTNNTPGFYYYDGASWTSVGGGGTTDWSESGNAATAGSQTGSFLGTTNSVQLRIRTNNIERAVWDSAIAQLRIGGASRNSDDGIIVMTPGIGNYDGISVYVNGGSTPTTYAYAGIERGGGFTIKMTSSNASITPTVYIGGEFGSAPDRITIAAGTTSIAPFQMASSPLTTGGNIRGGQFTYLSDKFYGAITTGPAHKEFTLNDGSLTSGRVPYATTNGRLTDAAELQFTGTSLGIGGSPGSANLLVTGTTATLTGVRVLSTIVPAASGDAFGIYSNPTMTEAGSGTHDIFATLRLAGPNVTVGAGALTRTAAIYMADNSNGVVTEANYAIYSLLTGPSVFNGDLSLATTGNKLSIATGSNASIGVSGALSGGSVTVSTTVVTASSKIFLTHATLSGTQGILSVGTITAGTSFVINSSSGTDAGTVNWWIIN